MASELAAALAKVQAELPRIKKDKTADTGKYKYKYADLADVSDAILPVLARHGLAWSALPLLRDDGQFVLRYKLMHASGEELTGDYPLDRGTAQQNGGWITYARRYALGAVTGVATEEDTDGRSEPEKRPAPRSRPKPQAEANGHTEPTADPGERATPAQVINIHWKRLGIEDREERLVLTGALAGREIHSTNELDTREQLLVKRLLGQWRDISQVHAHIEKTATP